MSFTKRTIAAIRYSVEPIGEDMRIVLQSDLLANEPVPAPGDDPRLAAALDAPLVASEAECRGYRALLSHQTKQSGLRLAAGMDHEVDYPDTAEMSVRAEGDLARLTVAAHVPADMKLTLTKYIGYGWSGRRSAPALRAQVDAAVSMAMETGWDELLRSQREFLDHFWLDADIELDGDPPAATSGAVCDLSRPAGGRSRPGRAIPARARRPRLRRPHLLGHRNIRPAHAHLHHAGCRASRCSGDGTGPSTRPGIGA